MPEELENKEASASRQKSVVIGVALVVLAVVIAFGALQYQKIQRDNASQKAVTGEEGLEFAENALRQKLQTLDEETKDNPRLSSEELQARLKALDAETENAP